MPDKLVVNVVTGETELVPFGASELAEANAIEASNAERSRRAANRTTISDAARNALASNATFLAIASPSNAQVAAQVKALTRQNNSLIRLILDEVSDVT